MLFEQDKSQTMRYMIKKYILRILVVTWSLHSELQNKPNLKMETIIEEMSLNLFSPPKMSCNLTKLKEIYFGHQSVSSSSYLVFLIEACYHNLLLKFVMKMLYKSLLW